MAGLLPAPAQRPWKAYERWVRLQLDRVASAKSGRDPRGAPDRHDPHLEAPEAVASLVHHWLSTDSVANTH